MSENEKENQVKQPKEKKVKLPKEKRLKQPGESNITVAVVLKEIWKWIYIMRGIFLAVPVALGAGMLAMHNRDHLPAQVGINLLENGQYAHMVEKNIAIMGPLALTAVCLLMVFFSRRVLYPWIISVFSLVLPILIYITNVFPG